MSGFTQALAMVATSAVLSSLLLTFSVNQINVTKNISTITTSQSASLIDTNNKTVVYTDLSAIQIPTSTVTESDISDIKDTPFEAKTEDEDVPQQTEVKVKNSSHQQIVDTAKDTSEPIIEPTAEIKEPITEKKPTTSNPTNATLDKTIHQLTNKSRTDRNLAPLVFDNELAKLATARSKDMIENDYFSHESPDGCDLSCRFKKSGYVTLSWGENIAEIEGYETKDYARLAKQFTDNWLESRGHRDNILSDTFTHQGVGTAEKNDRVVVTVIFATP